MAPGLAPQAARAQVRRGRRARGAPPGREREEVGRDEMAVGPRGHRAPEPQVTGRSLSSGRVAPASLGCVRPLRGAPARGPGGRRPRPWAVHAAQRGTIAGTSTPWREPDMSGARAIWKRIRAIRPGFVARGSASPPGAPAFTNFAAPMRQGVVAPRTPCCLPPPRAQHLHRAAARRAESAAPGKLSGGAPGAPRRW